MEAIKVKIAKHSLQNEFKKYNDQNIGILVEEDNDTPGKYWVTIVKGGEMLDYTYYNKDEVDNIK